MSLSLPVSLEHYDALAALAPQARSYLEVGTHEGGSLRAVVAANPAILRVVCVDNWSKRVKAGRPGGHAHIEAMLAEMRWPSAGRIEYLDGASTEMLPQLAGLGFDLTLVDATHTEDACYSDMRLTWPLTTKAMVVHDVWLKMGVRTALWRFLRELPAGSASASLCAGDHGTLILRRIGAELS